MHVHMSVSEGAGVTKAATGPSAIFEPGTGILRPRARGSGRCSQRVMTMLKFAPAQK